MKHNMVDGARPRHRANALLGVALVATAGLAGPVVSAAPAHAAAGASRTAGDASAVTEWNGIAVRTIVTEAQVPPPASQLYFGIVSAAVYDAVVAVEGRYEPYISQPRPHGRASSEAAAATAAYEVLSSLFPASAEQLAVDHAASLARISGDAGRGTARGVRAGERAAAAIVQDREGDGRDADIGLEPTPGPGVWEPTPPGSGAMAVPWLGFVRPLMLDAPDQVPLPGPDALDSTAYAQDFAEVKELGSVDSTARTPAQTETARFWSDNPIRQYQDGLRGVSDRRELDIVESARMFALVNTTGADALVACWRVKHDHAYWRPSTAIQRAEEDGNPATKADPSWTPLIANPAYPEYPSGHACLSAAVASGLAHLFGSDSIDFEVGSNVTGTTRDFATAGAFEQDAMDGRVWLGIHFRRAMLDGNQLGHEVSDWGIAHYFQPVDDHCS
ncbi:MAG: phosphatase PAP2 family protein [Acidimicrobiia bacterium]|nr:phosphatase PAP2 family protein [Acidimicrobiia bacterium]